MLLLDASELQAYESLIMSCNAYAAFTGGRFIAQDFEAGATRSHTEPDFEAARLAAAEAVASFTLLVKEEEILLAQYEKAYRLTVHEAALATMGAALKSVEMWPETGFKVEDVTLDDARDLALPELAEKLAAAQAYRKASNAMAARIRAASFVADFGAAVGLDRVPCPDDAELLRVFYAKLEPHPLKSIEQIMRDSFAPYADLFAASNFAEAKDWFRTHPDEVSTLAAVGAATVGLTLAVVGIFSGGRVRGASRRV